MWWSSASNNKHLEPFKDAEVLEHKLALFVWGHGHANDLDLAKEYINTNRNIPCDIELVNVYLEWMDDYTKETSNEISY